MKPTVHELFELAANDVGLKVHRSGAMLILTPKKTRRTRRSKSGKNGKPQ